MFGHSDLILMLEHLVKIHFNFLHLSRFDFFQRHLNSEIMLRNVYTFLKLVVFLMILFLQNVCCRL